MIQSAMLAVLCVPEQNALPVYGCTNQVYGTEYYDNSRKNQRNSCKNTEYPDVRAQRGNSKRKGCYACPTGNHQPGKQNNAYNGNAKPLA